MNTKSVSRKIRDNEISLKYYYSEISMYIAKLYFKRMLPLYECNTNFKIKK